MTTISTTGRGRRNCADRKRVVKEERVGERRRSSSNSLLASFVFVGSLSLLFLRNSYSFFSPVFADELLAQEAELEKRVTCGSAIKLTHTATKAKLHSHGIGYGSGSGQQSVTGFPESNDPGGYWQVFGTREEPCERGEDIADGRVIRLRHVQTRKWLHSHAAHRSPETSGSLKSRMGIKAIRLGQFGRRIRR